MENAEFYKLFAKCGDDTIVMTTLPGKQNVQFRANDSEGMYKLATEQGKSENVYIGCNPRKNGLPVGTRGGEKDVSKLLCLVADCDVKSPAHKENALPPTKEAAIEALSEMPLVPSLLIDSGYGIYSYYLLECPCNADDERVPGIQYGFGKTLQALFGKYGWKADNVFCLSHMFRAPGSYNHKLGESQPCKILSEEIHFYTLDELSVFYMEPPQAEHIPFEADERAVGSAERIAENCRFIKKMQDAPDEVTEPEWKAQCSNVVLTADGAEKFHEWSSLYSNYSYDETETKIKYSIEAKKPCTCKYIKEGLSFPCPEGGCGVKAPIVFALYHKDEQIRTLLSRETLDADAILEPYFLELSAWAKENAPADYIRLKNKVKKAGIGMRDFEAAVRSETEKKAVSCTNDFSAAVCLDGIDLDGAVEPNGYHISLADGVMVETYIKGVPVEETLCAEPVVITGRSENIDNGQERMEISFFRNHRWKRLVAPRSTLLNKNALIRLSDAGLPVTSDNAERMVRYLSAYESANAAVIPFTRSIDRIGWIENEFYPCAVDAEITYENDENDEIVSAICESGDMKVWLSTAGKLRENPIARAILNASFASPLLELLKHRVFSVHVWCASRGGKTATLKFALSVWGDPIKLMGNFNSTLVGLERRAGTLKHLPLGLDELQVLNEKRLTAASIIYTLGNGIGKTRGAKGGGLQNVPTWRNSIICTGEQPLCSDTAMDGVSTRVLELYGSPVENADFGRSIHQISETNYGFAGARFIRYLQQNILCDKDKLNIDFSEMREALSGRFENDPGIHLDNVAVLALADMYASNCLFGETPEVAFEEAVKFGISILQNAKSLEKEDVVERAWNFVVSWVVSNKSRFELTASPCYGKIDLPKERVYALASILRQSLEDNGFNYAKSIRGFKERGYIDFFSNTEGKENTQCQKKIQGVNARVVSLKLKVESSPEDFLINPIPPLR